MKLVVGELVEIRCPECCRNGQYGIVEEVIPGRHGNDLLVMFSDGLFGLYEIGESRLFNDNTGKR